MLVLFVNLKFKTHFLHSIKIQGMPSQQCSCGSVYASSPCDVGIRMTDYVLLVYCLITAHHCLDGRYIATINGPIHKRHLLAISEGTVIDGVQCTPDSVELLPQQPDISRPRIRIVVLLYLMHYFFLLRFLSYSYSNLLGDREGGWGLFLRRSIHTIVLYRTLLALEETGCTLP